MLFFPRWQASGMLNTTLKVGYGSGLSCIMALYSHGGKAAIETAGRREVERGLNRVEGKPTNISAAGHAPALRDWERGGDGDGTGAAPTTDPQVCPAR